MTTPRLASRGSSRSTHKSAVVNIRLRLLSLISKTVVSWIVLIKWLCLHLETCRAGTSISKNVKPEYLFNADQQKMLDKMPDVVSMTVISKLALRDFCKRCMWRSDELEKGYRRISQHMLNLCHALW